MPAKPTSSHCTKGEIGRVRRQGDKGHENWSYFVDETPC